MRKKILQLFKDHYTDIVEWSCGFKLEKEQLDIGSSNKNGVLIFSLDKCKNKPSIVEIHKIESYNLVLFLCSVPVRVLR